MTWYLTLASFTVLLFDVDPQCVMLIFCPWQSQDTINCNALYGDPYHVLPYMETIIMCCHLWRGLSCAVLHGVPYHVLPYMETIITCCPPWRPLSCAALYGDHYHEVIKCCPLWRPLLWSCHVLPSDYLLVLLNMTPLPSLWKYFNKCCNWF